MPRIVTLALVRSDGVLLGALPAFRVETPWWQETAEVVAGARDRFGVEVAVLRLLRGENSAPPGGAVTYLAEVATAPAVPLEPVDVDLADDPRRADYARPGGPAASLDWAADRLADLGLGPIGTVTQQRTWNLSAIWRLETAAGTVWLKQVPRIFLQEHRLLRRLAAEGFGLVTPMQLATDGRRMLLAHIPGEDLYGAALPVRQAIADRLHDIQLTAAVQTEALLDLGVDDLRGPVLSAAVKLMTRGYADLDPALVALVDGLPARMAQVEACGLPETLVHGDFHPGNTRGDENHQVILDWGDAFIGHPAFDILRLTEDVSDADADVLLTAWAQRWREDVPGSAPERAVELLRPVAALRNALVYHRFLRAIEPSEHPYHAADVPYWLKKAITG
ncbi:MAG: aminoglycoside phosphotransferase family protein [Hamadaea sp.]|nr:aminoglycoside phosphotransferase family protein [Hamadaea sp.]